MVLFKEKIREEKRNKIEKVKIYKYDCVRGESATNKFDAHIQAYTNEVKCAAHV